MADLEDNLNVQLRTILNELNIKNEEAIVFAREIFLKDKIYTEK